MKKITILLAMVFFAGSIFAQTEKKVWPEMKEFHTIMAATFHPAEENDLKPLKAKVAELYRASKVWYASEVPSDFKKAETTELLQQLMVQCNDIWSAVNDKADDAKLKNLITMAHDIFHKVAGTCKKD